MLHTNVTHVFFIQPQYSYGGILFQPQYSWYSYSIFIYV